MSTIHRVKKNKKVQNFKKIKIFLCMIQNMRYSYCIYYKCSDVVCEIFFFSRCVNSISRLCLCLRDTSLNFKLAIR